MQDKEKSSFVVSKENWSLHRKGYQDQQRHIDKVKDAIKNNLPDLVSEESIIMSNGRDKVKIPIRSLDEYKIRYNYDKSDRKSTRLNSSHVAISYAVFCLKKKKKKI